jgi:hypothetical protein
MLAKDIEWKLEVKVCFTRCVGALDELDDSVQADASSNDDENTKADHAEEDDFLL